MSVLSFDFSAAVKYNGAFSPILPFSSLKSDFPCTQNSDCISPKYCYSESTGERIGKSTGASGQCSAPVQAVINTAQVELDPTACFSNIPLSITIARRLYSRYANDLPGLLKEGAYRCFCSQQVNFNADTNFYIYPPYNDGGVKEVCQPYFEKLVDNEKMSVIYSIIVVILNFILRKTLKLLTRLELHLTWDELFMSMALKFLPMVFLNTSILFLISNGYFMNTSNVLGFGFGSYSEISQKWYSVIGKGYVLSIVFGSFTGVTVQILVGRLIMWVNKRRKGSLFSGRDLDTFEFATRSAFTGALISGCCFFCSGMPVLIFIGLGYCIMAYYFDRLAMFRLCQTPPKLSGQILGFVAEGIIFFGIFLHSLLTMWLYSNQTLFPSELSIDAVAIAYSIYVAGSRYSLTSSGALPTSSASYNQYLRARAVSLLRKGSLPSLALACVSGGYLLYRLVSSIFACQLCRNRSQIEGPTFSSLIPQLQQEGEMFSYDISDIARV